MVVLRPVLPPPIQPFSSTAMLRQAVLARQIVGGPQSVAAAADDHGVIAGLGLGAAPLRLPATLARKSFFEERECGKKLHLQSTCEIYALSS